MVGFKYGGDGDFSLDGVNSESGLCRGISKMVGSPFVSGDISTRFWTRS